MDVKMAFLNGKLEEEIYMKQLTRFDDGSGKVCKLKRAIYGLKQAGNAWNKEWNKAMEDLGYRRLKTDYCCYVRRDGDDFTIILIWVDNLISFAKNASVNAKVECKLKTKFEINVIGEPSMLLGMKITRNYNKGTIILSQTHYINVMLSKFGMSDANPISTLLDLNLIK